MLRTVAGVAGSEAARMRQVASGLSPRIKEHNLTLVAAGVAFYAFLAFVPALVSFISIYGLVADPDDVADQVADVASALPEEVQDFVTFQLTSIASANRAGVSFTLVIAIALALWSASGGMAALITGIHVAHEHDEPSGFVAKRGKALGLTLGAMVFLGIVIFVIAAVPPLLSKAGLGTAGEHRVRCSPLARARGGDDGGDRPAVPSCLEGLAERMARVRHAGAVVATIGLARRLGRIRFLHRELREL